MIPRYQSPEIDQIWSDENRYREWFKVELAYLEAYLQHHDRADDALMARLYRQLETIDWSDFAVRVNDIDAQVKHDVIAFLQALESSLGDDARLIHCGLTSSDVVDTACARLLVNSAQHILAHLKTVIESLWEKAQVYQGVMCLGRTHGQAAEPTTFGLKLLSHMCEFARGHERLSRACVEMSVGKLSGAVGVYAHTHPSIEKNALKALGLEPETVATQVVARDRHAYFFTTLATLAGSIERLATEIRLLMHGEVQEAFEPFGHTQKGSSAMPHKKNPVLSENLCGLMRLVRTYALSALENQALWHERDISHSSVERVIAPDATHLLTFALIRLNGVVKDLVVDQDRLSINLENAGDVLYSQGVLRALVEHGIRRQTAYELVQKAALTVSTAENFLIRLRAIGILNYLSEAQLNEIFSAKNLLRHEDILFERAQTVVSRL